MGKINARKKGNSYELKVAKKLKELGFLSCATSRFESKKTDDEGIDLVNVHPLQIQIKAVERLGSVHAIINRIPRRKGKFNLLWHKRNHMGAIVAMSEEDFLTMLKLLIDSGVIVPEC